jgi:hypothetical protein
VPVEVVSSVSKSNQKRKRATPPEPLDASKAGITVGNAADQEEKPKKAIKRRKVSNAAGQEGQPKKPIRRRKATKTAAQAPIKTEKEPDTELSQEAAAPAMVPPPLNKHGMYFDSFGEAISTMRGLNWPPKLDRTLPVSDAARRAIVKELHAAIDDMSDCKDKVGSIFKKRWLGGKEPDVAAPEHAEAGAAPASDKFYHPWLKEKTCWKILVIQHCAKTLISVL